MHRRDKMDDARACETAGAGVRSLAAIRFAREEVADVLAEALWSLICAGRWPGRGSGGAPPAASATVWPGAPEAPKAVESRGV